jgi:hypothetical protein
LRSRVATIKAPLQKSTTASLSQPAFLQRGDHYKGLATLVVLGKQCLLLKLELHLMCGSCKSAAGLKREVRERLEEQVILVAL